MTAARRVLDAQAAIALATAAGLPVSASRFAENAEGAAVAAREIGFPVVVKAAGLSHKSERGGVVLGLTSEAEVEAAAGALLDSIGAEALPLLVQRQHDGAEILVGARRAPSLGASIVIGAGGVAAELLSDVAEALVPLDLEAARRLFDRLRTAPLFTGYRGVLARDVRALCEVIVGVSRLMTENREIEALDLNPVLVGAEGCGVVVVDVRIVVAPAPATSHHEMPDLDRMMRPRHVALVGVSEDPTKIGAKLLEYFDRHGFEGRIDVVHRAGGELRGRRRYRSLADIDGSPDLVCVAVPAAAVLEVARDAVKRKVGGVIVHSSGFGESGAAGGELEAELVRILAIGRIPLVGPNSMGIISPLGGVTPSISGLLGAELITGGIGFITSSGALGSSIGSRFMEQRIGLSHWIHVGNEATTTAADYLAWLADDPQTSVVGLVLESIGDGDALIDAGRRLRRAGKVAIAYNAARSRGGERTVETHTGAIAGAFSLREAILERAGIASVPSLQVLEDALAYAVAAGLPSGRRLGAITPSGGACTVIADEAEANGIDLPPFPLTTEQEIVAVLPSFATVANPLDVTAQIITDQGGFIAAFKAMLHAGAFDAVLVQFMTHPDPGARRTADAILAAREESPVPVYVSRYGAANLAPEGMARYASVGMPVLDAPDRAVRAIAALIRARELLDEP